MTALARRRHGVRTYRQLVECGLTRRQIAVRVARDELYPLFRGVYALGPIVTARGRELDHRSARRFTAPIPPVVPFPDGP